MGVRALFLVGFMASGKSSVGQELARRLHWQFLDLDSLIEAREKQSVPGIFATRGESGFRGAETAALRDLLTCPPQDCVIALGGGAFAEETNRRILENCKSIFLEAPADELWRRSQQDVQERPLRKNREQFARLYEERLPYYRLASHTVNTFGKNVASICIEIESLLREAGDSSDVSAAHPSRGESL